MEFSDRIKILLEILNLNALEFSEKIGVQRSSVSHILSGRNKPSLDFIEKTLTVFKNINSEWLLLGIGKPIKEETKEETNTPSPTPLQGNTSTIKRIVVFYSDGKFETFDN